MNQYITDILSDGAWLAHRHDSQADRIQFQHVSRERRNAAPFLTDQDLRIESRPAVIGRSEAMAGLAGIAPSALHFLFHSGFCSSTMLVKAIDRPGSATGLSEPVILNDLVGFARRGATRDRVNEVGRSALRLLARPLEPDEAVVVKPSNIVNPRIVDLLELAPQAKAILLHAPLGDFLASVIRKGLWCRIWARQLMQGYRTDGFADFGFSEEELFLQTDLQIAAIGWLGQQRNFAGLLARFPERLRSLHSRRLGEDPAGVLAAALRFYGIAHDDADALDRRSAIARNSKTGEAYSRGAYEAELAGLRAAHGDEIEKVEQWAGVVADTFGIPLDLSGKLMPT
jgi:hypothetical protein